MMESDLAEMCNTPKTAGAIALLHVHAQLQVHAQWLNLPLIWWEYVFNGEGILNYQASCV